MSDMNDYFRLQTPDGEVKKIIDSNEQIIWRRAIEKETTESSFEGTRNTQLKALKQYGFCEQDGTPTPSAPVDIMCNNGALRMVDDELPIAYKRVLGFACNNNAMWEIPDFYIKGTDTLRVSFSITATSNLIGSYSGSTSGPNYSIYASTSNVNYLRYYNTNYNSQFDADTRYDIVMTPTGTHGMKKDSEWETVDFTTERPFCIGTTAANITTSAKLKGNLYGDIIVDGRLHLVPCERISDNVLGYYDTISDTFYEPYEGFDGAVSLGYDGSHYSLAVVGTPEVLTVTDADSNTQTASVESLFALDTYADEQEIIGGVVTHNVGVKALDGTESIFSTSETVFFFAIDGMKKPSNNMVGLSTHYQGTDKTHANMPDKSVKITYSGDKGVVAIKDTDYSTKADFSAYLAAQYAAGTPVIVLYPLATETTESVMPQPIQQNIGLNFLNSSTLILGGYLTIYYGE